MKVFRVATQREGLQCKAPGVSTTQLERVDRYYAAETMQQVWDAVEDIRSDPEEEFIGIVLDREMITVLPAASRDDGPEETK